MNCHLANLTFVGLMADAGGREVLLGSTLRSAAHNFPLKCSCLLDTLLKFKKFCYKFHDQPKLVTRNKKQMANATGLGLMCVQVCVCTSECFFLYLWVFMESSVEPAPTTNNLFLRLLLCHPLQNYPLSINQITCECVYVCLCVCVYIYICVCVFDAVCFSITCSHRQTLWLRLKLT